MRAKSCCAEMTGEGQPVRWLRSFYLPETAQTHCYFEAASKAQVEEAHQSARIPVHADCGSGGDDAGNGVKHVKDYWSSQTTNLSSAP